MPRYRRLHESYQKYLEGRYLSTVAGESLEGTVPVYFISLTEYPDVRPCFTKSNCVIEALGWLFMKFLAT
jgi:hypothetical protein